MALYSRCDVHARLALSHHVAVDPPNQEMIDKLESIQSRALAHSVTTHAKGLLAIETKKNQVTQLEQQKMAATPQDCKFLLDNLEEYSARFLLHESGPKLIDFPPKMKAITCKPLLFDLALSECSFPDLTERKKAPRTSFFSRLWG
eukprot:TRINITY_DN2565_c0_g1_i8.p2 TRINITY_DN2565_c0_g1~~TRINITY_DN2565_c0_g1_i8.p2  ORF type:complete len:146 (-),score=38.86 TRINITY_DN2565_c0_g1_i8:98-535(-)